MINESLIISDLFYFLFPCDNAAMRIIVVMYFPFIKMCFTDL